MTSATQRTYCSSSFVTARCASCSILAIEFAAQALLVLELFVLLRTTGKPFSVLHPFLIEAATKFIGLAFFFIPGQVGAAEGTYAFIFKTVGLPASAGFALAVARRLRSLLVAGAGLALAPLLRNSRKTERGAKQFLDRLAVRAAPFALLRNSRKTERGAKQFLDRLAVRAAPFALWRDAPPGGEHSSPWRNPHSFRGGNPGID